MNSIECVKEINMLIKSQNSKLTKENCLNIHSFTYQDNIKTLEDVDKIKSNPTISIVGEERTRKYYELYENLYKNMKMRNKNISLDSFMKSTQQLFFKNEFSIENIKNKINSMETMKISHVSRIFGVKLLDDTLNFGKFSFVKKEYILKYFKNVISNEGQPNIDLFNSQKKAELKSRSNFVYLVSEYDARDSKFCKENFDEEIKHVVNVLRFMAGVKLNRVYIDTKEFLTLKDSYNQFANNHLISSGMELYMKDIPVTIEEKYFNGETNGNKEIWELLSKNNITKLQRRILGSIDWIGTSIQEEDESIALTELAFAFECLLKRDDYSVISPSIQSHISESIAFIVGKDKEDRRKIVKDFKLLYSFRSSLAHGTKKEFKVNYWKYLDLIRKTIYILVTDSKYKNIKTIEEVFETIEDYKYR